MYNYNSESDEAIIKAVKDGDIESFGILIERYKLHVYRLVYRMVHNRDNAEDLVQEVFIKAYIGLKGFKSGHKFTSWLYRIAMNHTLNFIKNEKKIELQSIESVEFYSDGKDDPVQMVQEKILKERIEKAIEQLPAEQRAVIILRVQEKLSYEEIGKVLNISKGTVMSRLARARQRLKEILYEKRK
uniref:RNA polymerase sigma factor n=1 Tax=candidate division WOR-3 bacterium TaxID=2052148 RepID=A0A7V3RG83_UNCW3